MSQREFLLTLVTPDKRLLYDHPVTAVGAMGSCGAFAALPGHVPFLTDLLKPGELWYREAGGQSFRLFVSGGFVEVMPDKVTVLADSAEPVDEIDLERAQKAMEKAEREREMALAKLEEARQFAKDGKTSLYGQGNESLIEIREAEMKLQRAMARIKMAKKGYKGGQ
jgi:F-type H+-transporting ATPase subunit epsilon